MYVNLECIMLVDWKNKRWRAWRQRWAFFQSSGRSTLYTLYMVSSPIKYKAGSLAAQAIDCVIYRQQRERRRMNGVARVILRAFRCVYRHREFGARKGLIYHHDDPLRGLSIPEKLPITLSMYIIYIYVTRQKKSIYIYNTQYVT